MTAKQEENMPFPPNPPKAIHEYINHKQKHATLFEGVKAEFNAVLKQISESFRGLERHEVHSITSQPHNEPYYESLGLQYVPAGHIIDVPARKSKGSKPAAKASATDRAKKAGKLAVFKLSDEKSTEYLKAIGKGEKSAKEIEKALGIKNASNAINYLKAKNLIKISKQEGLKKFYKIA